MKVLLLNGSPRQGNTVAALEALKRGLIAEGINDITEIDTTNAGVSPCVACDSCAESGECIFDDDTNEVITEIVNADVVIFATPVYWWGVSAQLKLVIDKMYCQNAKLQESNKKAGALVVGMAEQDDPQYEIISKQFDCIYDYLGWENKFYKSYTAGDTEDLKNNSEAIAEIEKLAELFRKES